MMGSAGSALAGALSARFELSRGTDHGNVRPMEGLRGFAVLLVFLTHYVSLIGPWLDHASSLGRATALLHSMGNAGVDLFFVLSGYLIYGSLMARPQAFGPFMRRRVQRIYPAFLVVLALYIALSLCLPTYSKLPAGAGPTLVYLLQNLLLLPGLLPITPLITVAWSLSYEMFYYLVMPAVVGGLALRLRGGRARGIFWGLLSLALMAYWCRHAGPARLLMFVAGILLWELQRAGRRPPSAWLGALAAVVGLAVGPLFMYGPLGVVLRTACLGLSFLLLCWACFDRPKEWLGRGFSWTPLRWLGNMSYSFYLLHGLAMNAGFVLLGNLMPPSPQGLGWFLLWLAPMLVLSVIASAALYLMVELPYSLRPASKQRLPAAHTAGA